MSNASAVVNTRVTGKNYCVFLGTVGEKKIDTNSRNCVFPKCLLNVAGSRRTTPTVCVALPIKISNTLRVREKLCLITIIPSPLQGRFFKAILSSNNNIVYIIQSLCMEWLSRFMFVVSKRLVDLTRSNLTFKTSIVRMITIDSNAAFQAIITI